MARADNQGRNRLGYWSQLQDQISEKNNCSPDLIPKPKALPTWRDKSYHSCSALLRIHAGTFYDSVVASALFYAIICWGEWLNLKRHKLSGEAG